MTQTTWCFVVCKQEAAMTNQTCFELLIKKQEFSHKHRRCLNVVNVYMYSINTYYIFICIRMKENHRHPAESLNADFEVRREYLRQFLDLQACRDSLGPIQEEKWLSSTKPL